MSIYRLVISAVAAIALATSVFADNTSKSAKASVWLVMDPVIKSALLNK